MRPLTVPPALARKIEDVFGDQGRLWLANLPNLLDECAGRWSLQIGPPFDLSYNYVVPVVRADGTEAVLKLGVPGRELLTEMTALENYAGRGSARLIDSDAVQGAMLLERLSPGTMLSTLEDDDRATRIAAGVMRELRRKAPPIHDFPHDFPSVADWVKGLERLRRRFDGGTGPLPRPLVEEAESLFAELLRSQGEPVLLHGDLHHFNILQHGDRWLAIDPKGVVGEAEYEIGALLRNPSVERLAGPDAVGLQRRRIEVLSEELGYDKRRIRDWAVAQAALSCWWGIEDHADIDPAWIASAERLAEVHF